MLELDPRIATTISSEPPVPCAYSIHGGGYVFGCAQLQHPGPVD